MKINTLQFIIIFLCSINALLKPSSKVQITAKATFTDGRYQDAQNPNMILRFDSCACRLADCRKRARSYHDTQIDHFIFVHIIQILQKNITQEGNINKLFGIMQIFDSYNIDKPVDYSTKFPYMLLQQGLCARNLLHGHRMNDYGHQPLHLVAKDHKKIDHAKALLSFGANVNKADYKNKTPLDLAVEYNDTKMIHFLMDHGGRCNNSSSIKALLEKNVLKRVILPASLQEPIS